MIHKTITIDRNKCNQDALCAMICPSVIRIAPSDGYPEKRDVTDDVCMNCGHCVAICPTRALEHSEISIDNCPPIKKEHMISEAQMIQFMRSRRTRRSYKSKAVDRDIIQKLINLARYAPSGGNLQKVEWTVFNNKAKLEKFTCITMEWLRSEITEKPMGPIGNYAPHHAILKDWDSSAVDGILWDAPALIIASAQEDSYDVIVNITLALSYLDLAAPTLGLGTCWIGTFTEAIGYEPLKSEINLPKNHSSYYAMILGYPKYKFHRLVERTKPVIRWHN